MKYRKILLAYNGSHEGKRALLECGDLAGFLNAETHLLAVASMPPSLFLTEGFVPEELLEEEKKRTQTVLDEGIRTLRDRGYNAAGHLAVGEPVEEICRLAKSLGVYLSVFGHKGRLEDERMLKGMGRYIADWNLPGQACGHFLRSDRAHAEIAALDASSALAMPGVIAVLTGADVAAAGLRPLPAAAPVKGRGGAEQLPTVRPALAQGRVRYVGEPVALVVAESTAGAQDAAETGAGEYRELPAVIDARVALARGAPLLHENVPGNLLLDFAGGDEAAAEAAFRRAAR